MAARAWIEPGESQEPEIPNHDLPRVWQGLKYMSHICYLPVCALARGWIRSRVTGTQPRHPKQSFHCCTTCPTPFLALLDNMQGGFEGSGVGVAGKNDERIQANEI